MCIDSIIPALKQSNAGALSQKQKQTYMTDMTLYSKRTAAVGLIVVLLLIMVTRWYSTDERLVSWAETVHVGQQDAEERTEGRVHSHI